MYKLYPFCHNANIYFAVYIADLKAYDWLITSTPATNDKGVDIIASKHGRKLVFQCRNWNKKADMSPVQEIFTG